MSKSNNRNTPLLLVELLESFSEKELEGLRYIINCPYFNTDKYVIQLLDVLIKNIIGKDWTPEATQIRLFNKVFCNSSSEIKKLDKKQKAKLNSKMSLLTRLAERFLQIDGIEKSQSNRCEVLMESLLERKQYRLFNKHLAKEKKSIENDPKDFYYFKKLHLFEEEEFQYLTSSGKWMKEDNFEKVMESLDLRYLAKKISYTMTGLGLMNFKSKKYDFSFLDDLTKGIFSKINFDRYTIFKTQIAIINLRLRKTDILYFNLLDLLDLHVSIIPNYYIKSFYGEAVNFCITQTKKGKTEYFQHYVNLHKIMDSKNLLLHNDSISIIKLRNMLIHGCKIKEFDWLNKMLGKYSPYINKRYQENVIKFSLGYIAFEQKKFQNAIDLLLQVNNFQKSYDINKRTIILKSYYELEQHYSEPTAQLFRSMESFIKNHKLLNNKDKIAYKTFIRIFYNLYRLKHKVGIIKLDKLKDNIEQAEFISNKLWLLKKIEELENKK